VIVDKGYNGVTADLWSCGVILFVLMAGYLPFDEPNLLNLYRKIYRAEFTCPSWFSADVKRLLFKVLDPNAKTVSFNNTLLICFQQLEQSRAENRFGSRWPLCIVKNENL
jgi:serine/threonine protein kinase